MKLIIYILALIFLSIILYFTYTLISNVFDIYINPCLIKKPQDFDCWNFNNVIISLVLSIFIVSIIWKILFKSLIKFYYSRFNK